MSFESGSIPRLSSWCTHCLVPTIYPTCPHHVNGEDYEGRDVHEPSKWVKQVVGAFYDGTEGVYECVGYDPRSGFWMRNLDNPDDLRNVSERAINRTFNLRLPKYVSANIMGSKGIPPEAMAQFPRLVKETPTLEVFSAVHNRVIGCAYGYSLKKGDIWAELEVEKRFADFDIVASAVEVEDEVIKIKGIVVDSSKRVVG